MNKPTLQIGNGNWGSKDGSLLGYVEGDTIDKFAPVFLDSTRGANIAATRVGKDGLIEKGRRNLLSFSNNFDNPIWIGEASWVGGQAGYDGTNNAWNFTKNNPTNSDLYNESFSGLQTFSIYAKKEDNKGLKIIAFHTGGDKRASFNLATGEDVASSSDQDIHSHAEDLNNGWWRLSFTINQTNAKWYLYTTDGTNTQIVTTVTLQNAQLEYGLAPSKYINTGSSVNLLRNTNQIEETPWTVSSGMDTITPNQLGYDGTRDAFLMTKDGQWARIEQKIPKGISQPLVLSAYVKSNDLDNVVFRIDSDPEDANNRERLGEIRVNIDTLEKNAETEGGSAHLTKVGNGWTRVELRLDGTRVSGSAESYEMEIYIYPAHQTDGAGGTTGSIFIQDIQLEIGTQASAYVENSELAGILDDSPRIDYTDSDGYLVMEPTRANKVKYSEYFEDSSWQLINSAKGSLEFGYEAPDGTKSAYKVSNTGTGGQAFALYTVGDGTIVEGTTRSIWAKTVSGTGTVDLLTFNANTDNLFTITNQWQRFELTGSDHVDGKPNLYAVDFRGGGTLNEVILWGAQAEAGDFATSYIPTHGASVTRNQDLLSFKKDLAYEGWTVYAEVDNQTIDGGDSGSGNFNFKGQGSSNVAALFFFGTCFGYRSTDGTNRYICGKLGNDGDVFSGKWAVTYDGVNTIKVYVDGSEDGSATDVDPNYAKGFREGNFHYEGAEHTPTKNIKDFRFYDKTLTQAEAEALTA